MRADIAQLDQGVPFADTILHDTGEGEHLSWELDLLCHALT